MRYSRAYSSSLGERQQKVDRGIGEGDDPNVIFYFKLDARFIRHEPINLLSLRRFPRRLQSGSSDRVFFTPHSISSLFYPQVA